jgi:hypothetical protein
VPSLLFFLFSFFFAEIAKVKTRQAEACPTESSAENVAGWAQCATIRNMNRETRIPEMLHRLDD